ncbi:MAG: PIN domain-containing protein [Chloroflexota bacterium]
MSDPYIDTDVIIRLLSGDEPDKQQQARELFEAVEQGKLSLTAPVTAIADAVYVFSSPRLYAVFRAQVAALLARISSPSNLGLLYRS